MSSVRWVHRKGQNCEKRVISLNEIKERYLNDAANQRKDRRNEKPFRDGINADTGGKKGKKKLITFYEKKAEKTANQQRGLSEKNVSIHFGKKKYCCSGEKGETKNGCSGCGGNVAPPGGQHGQHGAFGSAIDMGRAAIGGICGIGGTATIGRPLGGGSNPGPPHHAQPQVNINLDVNIQWNKQNGKIEKDICHVGGTSTFHGEKRTWHPTEGDREGNTEDDGEGNIRVPISEKRSGENGNWSDSPVGYEQGRCRQGEVPPPWEAEKYEKHFRYGNPREGQHHQYSGGEYLQRNRGGGNHPHGEIPNPLKKNRQMNRFAEECTTYDGMRPPPYVPLEKSHGDHARGNPHYEAEKGHSQLRYNSGGQLHQVREVERHGGEPYEGGAKQGVRPYGQQHHLYVKQSHPCGQHPHPYVKHPHLYVKHPLADPLKMDPPKDRQKYASPVDPKPICSDGEEKRKNSSQGGGQRAYGDSGGSSDFSEGGLIRKGQPKRGGREVPPQGSLPLPHDHHRTAYPLSSEEVLLRGAKQQKEYEQDRKKKKKIILSINKISNILKKKILKYLTRWREHSIVRPPRPVYKKYSKIVSPTENHHGGKNGGSLTALSGHTTESAFPRRVDMPLLSFQRVPNGGNYPERGIPNPLGGGVPQGGSKEETSLRVNTEETIPKSELSHCNESGVPPFAKKNSKECLKVYRQLSQRKVLTNTLIDSFNDVDIHDQRKKKKYLKFFSILLCLFLRRHMHRQLSVFFSVMGSWRRRQEEKRSIRKFINSRVYAVTILEGALKRREKKKALRQLALLEREKRGGREDKQTLHHYGDHPIESNSTEESSVLKSAPHPVEPSHRDNSLHDHRVADCTEENEPKLTPSRSHEKPCFGKPKIFRTDDFAMFFKKKILKEKDDILQKCLLRSKSDAVLDFLKMSRMENFSKKATCSSAVLNFPDAVYYNEDMRSSTLLDRFFTATYSPEVHTGHHHPHRDKIHLSFYEHMSDNCTMVRSSVDYHHSQNKRETYMHFKRECFETGGGNSTDSARQSGTGGKERLPTSVADAINTAGAKVGSTSDVMNKLGCLIGDSNFLSGVTAGGGNQMDDSSEEDVNDKRCRMFFKQFKKQLTMKCREAAPGEELRGDDRHSGEDHLGEADEAQNGLSLSDLNSTVGVSKDGATYT
ncbi:unnamed protein product [Plasmodium vivax]|uniref:(malaria parasite P. vivax) hypothetical protein n=1 Tax=Plasmodium vivax TaxID=5855 RepID=A0A8S4HDB1_PLAVI|nr:unnamed protein product [Plasmodium vivax]